MNYYLLFLASSGNMRDEKVHEDHDQNRWLNDLQNEDEIRNTECTIISDQNSNDGSEEDKIEDILSKA